MRCKERRFEVRDWPRARRSNSCSPYSPTLSWNSTKSLSTWVRSISHQDTLLTHPRQRSSRPHFPWLLSLRSRRSRGREKGNLGAPSTQASDFLISFDILTRSQPRVAGWNYSNITYFIKPCTYTSLGEGPLFEQHKQMLRLQRL